MESLGHRSQHEHAARPETFLLPPWSGRGVYCDAFGLPSGKYDVWGEGHVESGGVVVIDFNTRLDTGIANRFEWVFAPGLGKVFKAVDRVTGGPVEGMITANGFILGWKLLHRTALGLRHCRVDSVFDIRSPSQASASTTISLWGVTVGTSSSHISRVAGS